MLKKYNYDMFITYRRKCDVLAQTRKEAEERLDNMWEDHIADSVPERIGEDSFCLEFDGSDIKYNCETEIREEKEDTEKLKEKSMRKYTYNVKAIYDGTISVVAESEEKAEKMAEDIYSSKIIDELPVWFKAGDYMFNFDGGDITLDSCEIIKEEKDTDVKEVSVLSPENVFGMISAINESYRKLYTEGK